MKKIMFVCLGNICRSPLAHAVFQEQIRQSGLSSEFQLESSGTSAYHVGELPDPRMRKTAAARGISMDHRSRQFRKSDLQEYDLILAMDESNRSDILALATTARQREKVRLFRDFDPQAGEGAEVPDPYYGGPKGFETVFDIVQRTGEALLMEISADLAR